MNDPRNYAREGERTAGDAAAEWVARHDRGLSPAEEREFATWKAAPHHAAAWEREHATFRLLDSTGDVPGLATIAAQIDERTRRSAARRRSWLIGGALAAAAAVAIGLFIVRPFSAPPAEPAYRVVAAESRRVNLPDGSVIEARGDSEVNIDYTDSQRRVQLPRGEAFFTVAPDPARPFVVEAGGVVVRAVGTAFVVRHDAAGVDVLVAEGRVRAGALVDAPEIAPLIEAGAAARVGAASGAALVETRRIESGELERSLAWRSPMLEFSRASLDQVLQAFREHASHRVRLGTPALRERTISGTFQADNIDGFLRLAGSFNLRVERGQDGDIVLLPAP